ncbi:hypothetical protein MMC25_006647 [Agyrium rufum]|nr:hypothetical protein [Agyrium rufum]
MVSSRSIEPALSQLDPASIPCIAGIASINYRLSPYPFHPVNPSRPDDPSRSVVHPAHIEDVLTAIQWLQNEYGFGKNYLLAGHSCGATLALQAVMGEWEGRDDGEKKADLKSTDNFVTPIALLGVEGIYDLPLLLKSFSDPIYRSFLEAAFGTDESKWIEASPTTGRFSKSWRNGLVCVVTFSKGDTLIDEKQLDAMMKVLVRETSSRMSGKIFELTGSHDQIWFRGKELARAIRETIEFLSVNWT